MKMIFGSRAGGFPAPGSSKEGSVHTLPSARFGSCHHEPETPPECIPSLGPSRAAVLRRSLISIGVLAMLASLDARAQAADDQSAQNGTRRKPVPFFRPALPSQFMRLRKLPHLPKEQHVRTLGFMDGALPARNGLSLSI